MRARLRWLWLLPALGLALCCAMMSLPLTPERQMAADSVSLGLLLLDAEDGVYILAVSEGSAADQAGLLPGDCILAAGETPLPSTEAFNGLLQSQTTALPLTIRRDESTLTLTLHCR